MAQKNELRIVVLAAGKGTRMKSELPKVLVQLHGKHMIRHLLDSIGEASLDAHPIVVVGYEKELVMKELGDGYEYVVQSEQLGTGHAVMSTEQACANTENIIVISGDQPFLKSETIKNLWEKHKNSDAVLTITTTVLSDFEDWRQAFMGYGRIIRKGNIIIDKEVRDCTEEDKHSKRIPPYGLMANSFGKWRESREYSSRCHGDPRSKFQRRT
jgi:bifunctional UDP-N-acetylglucosamine pyrophosphorylase/glucosamine-1-phosphate N-acetyltransferase